MIYPNPDSVLLFRTKQLVGLLLVGYKHIKQLIISMIAGSENLNI